LPAKIEWIIQGRKHTGRHLQQPAIDVITIDPVQVGDTRDHPTPEATCPLRSRRPKRCPLLAGGKVAM